MTKGKKPDFIAKSVTELEEVGDNGKPLSRWTDIGVAYVNPKSETISIILNALPIGSRIVLAKPKEVEEQQPPKKEARPTSFFA